MKLTKNSAVTLAGSRALLDASSDDLRVLLCLIEDGARSASALAEAAGCSLARAESAVAYWRDAGVLQTSSDRLEKTAVETRDGGELAAIVDRHSLGELVDECEKLLSHSFNQTEINVIAGLVEDYCLDTGYIFTLLSYCVEIGKGSVKYMEKTALSLVDSGVETLAALDEYLKRRRENAVLEGQVRRLFGIGSRFLTKKEQAYVADWRLWGYDLDVVGIAYDIAVNATGKASLAYVNKILSGWHEAGARTAAECEAHVAREREKRPARAAKPKKEERSPTLQSFDTEDFFQKALERSYGKK